MEAEVTVMLVLNKEMSSLEIYPCYPVKCNENDDFVLIRNKKKLSKFCVLRSDIVLSDFLL